MSMQGVVYRAVHAGATMSCCESALGMRLGMCTMLSHVGAVVRLVVCMCAEHVVLRLAAGAVLTRPARV